MGGGGISAPTIPLRSFGKEIPDIKKGYGLQQTQLADFVAGNPLLAASQTSALSALPDFYKNYVTPVLASGGALTPEQERDVSQESRLVESQLGTAHTTGALGRELLNRQQYKEGRVQTALGESGTVLNQLLGTSGQEIQQFGALTNPILSYLSNLFGTNEQAQIAQAQLGLQASQANAGKGAGVAGGAISGISSIASAALPLLAASDERIKKNIRETGIKTKEGTPVKTFEYRTRPGHRFIGFTASDVEKTSPKDVFTEPVSGMRFVSRRFAPLELKEA